MIASRLRGTEHEAVDEPGWQDGQVPVAEITAYISTLKVTYLTMFVATRSHDAARIRASG